MKATIAQKGSFKKKRFFYFLLILENTIISNGNVPNTRRLQQKDGRIG